MHRILGFDPGLASTGWGIIDADGTRLCPVAYGSITTEPGDGTGERLGKIYDTSVAIIEKYRPEMAGIESLFFAKNITSAIPVAQARGILLLCLNRYGIEAEEFTPQEIKQSVTGAGRAEKKQMQEMVRILLGLKDIPKPDHAADALAAAVCAFNRHHNRVRGIC